MAKPRVKVSVPDGDDCLTSPKSSDFTSQKTINGAMPSFEATKKENILSQTSRDESKKLKVLEWEIDTVDN